MFKIPKSHDLSALEAAQNAYLEAVKQLRQVIERDLDPLLTPCHTAKDVMSLRDELRRRIDCDSLDGPLSVHIAVALASRPINEDPYEPS